ncbi:hypothetical protein P4O66_007704, partial [Electrophorus voltai]
SNREMAGRRTAIKAIDWLAFAERVPPNQRAMFNNLKTCSDAISARLASLPEKPAPIDWSYYRKTVAKAGMVDEFEKKFAALSIPEPVDTQTSKISAQEQEAVLNLSFLVSQIFLFIFRLSVVTVLQNQSAAAYLEASKIRIAHYEKELDKLKNMIPFDQMTTDDLNQAFPETKLDKEKYPYWPHKPIAEL